MEFSSIRPEGRKVPISTEVHPADESFQEGKVDFENPFVRTTEKTNELVKKMATPRSRTSQAITALADQIAKVQKQWDEFAPDELAESIIDLEDRVSVLKLDDSKEAQKVQEQIKHLHFQYVFPIARELDLANEADSIQIPFARQIKKIAQEIWEKNSLLPFGELNEVQQREILRYALSGRSE